MTTPRSDINQLLEDLRGPSVRTILAIIALYPRSGETGLLEEQGRQLESIEHALLASLPGAKTYRVLWAHLAVLVRSPDPARVIESFSSILASRRSEEIESRLAAAQLDQAADGRQLFDELQAELSSRRNFGKSRLASTWRSIDGVAFKRPWPSQV